MLAITNSISCFIRTFYIFYINNFQPDFTLIFVCNNISFTRYYIIDQIYTRLAKANILSLYYNGPSFQQEIAQYTFDNSILNENM